MNNSINKPTIQAARKRSPREVIIENFQIDERFFGLGNQYKYLVQTHGCQANEADSEKIHGLLEMVGFTLVEAIEEADLIIVNTCAVRESAENKVYGEIGRLKKFKKIKPELIIALGGCMSQEEATVEKILKTYPQVDIVFGTHNLHQLLEYLYTAIVEKKRVIEVFSEEGKIVEDVPSVRQNRYKAWVNIMYGCDEFCTYCIVPYTRGKERSRHPEHIIKEIQELADKGYLEVTLLGQNVNSYGLDLPDENTTFPNLLKSLSQIDIKRIRFTTSHPKDFSQELINVLATGKNLMPYIHLPVQSGSDKILKAMNKKYTKDDYLSLVHSIYTAIPDVSITTDIIVGFPGETETDFEATLDLVRKAKFEGAYTFIYSKREGTPAAKFTDDVSQTDKKTRLYKLNSLVNEGYLGGNQRFLDKIVDVLVEGNSKTKSDVLSGYTPNNKLVNFKGSEDLIGKIIPVRITKAKTWSLFGEIINE